MYECHQLSGVRYNLKSRYEVVRLISCLPKSNKGMKDDYLIASGEWSDSLHCPTRVGDPGGVYIFFFSLHPFSAMIFVNLTIISFLDIFADKDHVSPKLSHTNIQALNYLLRSKIFVSEDGQLRVAPLILDYGPLSRAFQDVG